MKLIRELEKKAKLHRLSGANSMALLLQNAADRIESLTVEAQTKDCELNSQKGVIQSVRDVFDIRVHDFNLIAAIKLTLEKRDMEQQAKGIDWVLACRELNLSEGEVHTMMDKCNQLRSQAKEAS